jgi:antitoxin (DNA-binding transcriptional repressor) of toxin-antitoxin stability system
MTTLELKKATKSLTHYARRARKGPVIVTVDGKPMAAVVALKNADMETVSLSNNPKFLALIERSRSRRKREGGLSLDQLRGRLGLSKASDSRRRVRKTTKGHS